MEKGVHSGPARLLWVVLLIVVAFAVAAGGYAYYQYETERIRQKKYEDLAAIGELKAGQIKQWRQEQLNDLWRSSRTPFFGKALGEWLRDPDNTVLRDELQHGLVIQQEAEEYADALVLDTDGRILLSAKIQPDPLSPEGKRALEEALANGSAVLSGLYRSPQGTVGLDAVVPIPDRDGRPMAALVLRSNADSYLYPLIQSWPTPSRTAETLLVRKEGEDLLFLNDLRHRPNSALSLREPLTRHDLPGVQAVLGKQGMFQGRDYRGVEVLADLRPILQSPWFMVAKVDTSEILAEARYRGGVIAVFSVLFILLAAGVTAYAYRYRQVSLYQDLYRSEREQREAQEEFRTTLYSIGDAVITTDTGCLVKQMNPVAERLTGRLENEARGRPIEEVFHIVNEETRGEAENPVQRVLREGVVVGLANHTLLISKNGTEHPIADSGAPIRDERGAIIGVVLVFQDQTENQRLLRERETRLTLLRLLNERNDTHEMIRNFTAFLQERSGFEAVGVRLKEGDDFPYFETRGFTQEFVQAENSLCGRDISGELLRDFAGNPVLECMCGNILSGRFNPALPFFTAKGSFWTNCTTELLASTTEDERQARTRNRCNGEGYESVGLFRLRSGDETLGLLQLNDRARGRFTPELLDFMENAADEIAMALAQRQAQARLRESEERFRHISAISSDVAYSCHKSSEDDYAVDWITGAVERITGYSAEEFKAMGCWRPMVVDNDASLFDDHVIGLAPGTTGSCELRLRHKNGGIVWVASFAECRVDSESRDNLRLYGGLIDITERKRAEAALRTSEAQLSNALTMAHLGHWEYDVIEDLFTFNDHFYKIFRSTAEQVGGYTMSSAEYARRFVHPDDIHVVGDEIRKSLESHDPHYSRQLEHRMLYADGEVGYITVRFVVVKDDLGRTVKTYGVNQDITERKRAEELVRQAEHRYRRLFEDAPLMYVITRNEKGAPIITDCNDFFLRSLGYARDEVQGRPLADFYSPESRVELLERGGYARALAGEFFIGERQLIRRDGSHIPTLLYTATEVDPSGKVTGTRAMIADITELKRADKALRGSEARYRSLFENMLDAFAYCRMLFENGEPLDFIYLDVNDAFERLTGLKHVIGRKVTELIPGIRESNPELFEIFGRVALTGNPEKFETYVPSLGIWLSISAYSTEREHFVAVFDNITERKSAEDALRESEERFRILADGAFEGVLISRGGLILDSNKVFCKMSGYTLEELVGMSIGDIVAPEWRDIAMKHAFSVSEAAYESAFVHNDGHVVPVQVKSKAIPYEGGTARIASVRDVTAVREAEEARKRLVTAIEQAAEAVFITDTEGIIQYVNPIVERITGFNKEEILGKTPRILKSGEHDTIFYRQLWGTIKAGNIWSGRLVNKKKDGGLFYEDATISPVRDASGEITNFVAVKRDITEHLELSRQLFRAQKMEAVGTLAGGVAHDFNNLLQVVLGYSELILADEDLPRRHRDDLARILQSARNGADLVHRLLTFSRKTEVKPRPLNLNRQIEQLQKMLSRTIPKMIEIELGLADDLAAINADRTQMDQVLMNLAVNASYAMPQGGRLIIETRNVILDEHYSKTHLGAVPGPYILLSVSDTGQGMDEETREHIFEPFFTTKDPGEGTGLGLAMVYGIVKQHGGYIVCYSEPGEGTTFKIYLPALEGPPLSRQIFPSITPAGGSETILLVDDEELVRDLGARILTRAGYTVLTATNGKEALEVYRNQKNRIALVLLDLIMPEMGGKQCLEELLEINPGAKVLIASGYSPNSLTKETTEVGARGFVSKPYDIRQLLETVREVLDS